MFAYFHYLPLIALLALSCGGAGTAVIVGHDAGARDAGPEEVARGCLALSSQSVDFGDVVMNTTATRSMDVTNRCGVEVSVTVSELSGTDALLFATVPAGGSVIDLQDGQATSLTIQYTPLLAKSVLDEATFWLELCDSGTGCWTLVSLRGHAVETGISMDPTTLDFGFGVSADPITRCVALTSLADATIHLTGDPTVLNGTELTRAGPFQPAPPFPPKDATIAPGETLLICVAFTPPPCSEKFTGELDLSTDDATASNLTIPLVGYGGGATLLCSPSGLDFGLNACGVVSTLSILCTNIGQIISGDPGANLVFWSLSFQSGNTAFSATFDGPLPDAGLAPGQSVKIDVTYDQTQPGTQTDTLLISTNDMCAPQPAIQLTATCR